ncbi:hypothetical protein F4780DRAFT_381995 [Xylariomycetidae sp. FL0641]|nr:hypothetical protein F4780DRAFT_381995 [Xylariomycetidae sp. FL0641]
MIRYALGLRVPAVGPSAVQSYPERALTGGDKVMVSHVGDAFVGSLVIGPISTGERCLSWRSRVFEHAWCPPIQFSSNFLTSTCCFPSILPLYTMKYVVQDHHLFPACLAFGLSCMVKSWNAHVCDSSCYRTVLAAVHAVKTVRRGDPPTTSAATRTWLVSKVPYWSWHRCTTLKPWKNTLFCVCEYCLRVLAVTFGFCKVRYRIPCIPMDRVHQLKSLRDSLVSAGVADRHMWTVMSKLTSTQSTRYHSIFAQRHA